MADTILKLKVSSQEYDSKLKQATDGRNMSGKSNRRALYKLQDEGDYYRGSIAPRNFFSQAGPRAMQ